LIEIAPERVELVGPELFIARHPGGRGFHGRGRELAAHHAAFLAALDQPRVLEHTQVLEEPGQRHIVRRRELGYRQAAAREFLQHPPACRVCERREHGVERILILNHRV
jgi:hypothetical protein